ncbi:hypothetical protein BH11BAC7_BH11BAC7_02460 [soil metagenome]
MNKNIAAFFISMCLTLFSCGESFENKDTLGIQYAKKVLKESLADSTLHNVINSKTIILKNETEAVEFAESILFDIYGKRQIRAQKPYEIYNIDNYWVIFGTLPKETFGGTFLIIIDAHDCRIVRITHGK